MEQVEVEITGQVITQRYGTLKAGDIVRTDAAFAEHLVEKAGAGKYCKPKVDQAAADQAALDKAAADQAVADKAAADQAVADKAAADQAATDKPADAQGEADKPVDGPLVVDKAASKPASKKGA